MNLFERSLRKVDGFQQRHRTLAVLFGVVKKFGDDNAGNLQVQLTFTGFVTIFPLLLLLVSVLGVVLANDPSARKAVVDSAFGEFPIIGSTLAHNIHALKRDSWFGFVVGALGLVYGSTGLAQAGLYSMEQIWNVPAARRPSYRARLSRSLLFLALLFLGLLISTGLSSFGTFGQHNVLLGYLAEIVAGLVNIGLYLVAFRLLTPRLVATRSLLPGAVFGGIAWTLLQALGGYVVGHYLKGSSATYGMFGIVLGLIAWIALGAKLTMYSAELNTVIHLRLWPRAMVQPPLTEADQRSVARQALENQRRPEQEISTTFHQAPMTEDEYREAGYELDTSRDGHSSKVPDDEATV